MNSLVRMYLSLCVLSHFNLPVPFHSMILAHYLLFCMLRLNPRLLTWELPEWRQSGRRHFTTSAHAFVSSHANI